MHVAESDVVIAEKTEKTPPYPQGAAHSRVQAPQNRPHQDLHTHEAVSKFGNGWHSAVGYWRLAMSLQRALVRWRR